MEKNNSNIPNITFSGDITVNGPMFDIHDNEHVHICVEGVGQRSKAEEVAAKTDALRNDAELVEKLKPIFYNNETDAKAFLKEITGMQPGDITDLVNRWVTDKRISDYGYSRKGVLWEILYNAGLYTKSRQNWCRRVD